MTLSTALDPAGPGTPVRRVPFVDDHLADFVRVCTVSATALPAKPSYGSHLVLREHAQKLLIAQQYSIVNRMLDMYVEVPVRIAPSSLGVPVIEWSSHPVTFGREDDGAIAEVTLPPPSTELEGISLSQLRTVVGYIRMQDERTLAFDIQTIDIHEQQAIDALKERSLWIFSWSPLEFGAYWWAVPRWNNRGLAEEVVGREAAWTLAMSDRTVYRSPAWAREEDARHVGNQCQTDGYERPPICTECKGVPRTNPFPDKITNWDQYVRHESRDLQAFCIC